MAEKGHLINKLDNLLDEELKLINAYARRNLSEDEVYVFSVILCDNDIDRDNERFTVESLFALEKLFVGRTGIIDHNPSATKQTARIFSCAVESVKGRKTATGDDYFRLKAKAYITRCEGNRNVIADIDSGIIKEVSIGCSVEKTVCSICGEDMERCVHRKGENYSGKVCCGELLNPYDAYEWSFVAVPSTKECEKSYIECKELLKKLEELLLDLSFIVNYEKKHGSLSDVEKSKARFEEMKGVINLIKSQPTANVQEIVRCKDCKKFCSYLSFCDDNCIGAFGHCQITQMNVSPDFYCGHGEKKDKE